MIRSIILSALAAVAALLPASGPARSMETVTIVSERIQRVSPSRQGSANRMRSIQQPGAQSPWYSPGNTKYPAVKMNRAADGLKKGNTITGK
jgi:hypothetical protein